MTTALVSKDITAVKLFEENGLDPVLDEIKKKIKSFEADPETKKGREAIRSFARKIASSKVFIEKAGKELVSGIKAKSKLIDTERKRSRDTLDKWRDEVRKPLTDYEEALKVRIENERLEEERQAEWADAIKENELIDRQLELDRKESELAKQEEERLAKEKEDREEKERLENEARIKAEAEEKARLDAEEKIKFEREEKERIEREAKEAKEKAENDAKELALKAERDKIAAEERAKIEKGLAIKKATEEAEAKAAQKERERLIDERLDREAAEKKAADTKHQASVNNKVLSGLMNFGIDETTAKGIIIATAKGEIEFLKILY